MDVQFPDKLQVLFAPKRHKVLYGGRGAGRSWGCARALLLLGTKAPIRILCVRELQNSIGESVHKLLCDQIEAMGLGGFYKIEVAKIYAANGTTFSFEGIKNNTSKIKSYEGIDYCWVEEANKVSRSSWSILIPTVRKEGSEIWLTFNPELETDYTYQRFVLHPSEDSVVTKMTYRDNPWFPEVLRVEMEDLRKRDPDLFQNVWEGFPLVILEGAVFAKELRRTQDEGRICTVPWDQETPVDTYWDLGRRDLTCIWFAQRVAMQYRLLAYFEDSQYDIHYYLQECQRRGYTYGTFFLPHDAKAKKLGERRTIEQIVRAMGYPTQVVPRTNKKVNAINAARIIFPNCWFDEVQCDDGLGRLRHYKYEVKDGQIVSDEPKHDEASNAADAFMTLAQSLRPPKRPSDLASRLRAAAGKAAESMGGLGWMGS